MNWEPLWIMKTLCIWHCSCITLPALYYTWSIKDCFERNVNRSLDSLVFDKISSQVHRYSNQITMVSVLILSTRSFSELKTICSLILSLTKVKYLINVMIWLIRKISINKNPFKNQAGELHWKLELCYIWMSKK